MSAWSHRLVLAALAASAGACRPAHEPVSPVPAAPSATPAPASADAIAAPASSSASGPEPGTLPLGVHDARSEWLAAFKARDADRVASFYAEDACIQAPPRPAICGRPAIAEATRAAWSRYPDVKVAWGRIWSTAALVAVESAWSTDGRGAVSLAVCTHTRDGLIREERVYSDGRASASNPPSGPGARPFDGLPTTREIYDAHDDGRAGDSASSGPACSSGEFSDDAELVDFGEPGSWSGKNHAPRWELRRTAGLPQGHLVVDRSWHVEPFALCEFEATGLHGAGKASVRGAEVVEVEAGKVKRGWRYTGGLETGAPASSPAALVFAVP